MWRWVKRVFYFFATWFLITVLSIVWDGFRDEGRAADLAVILGSKVEMDGQPSSGLERRLQKGLELYRQGRVKLLMVSGGIGQSGFDEAKVMKSYLVQAGVPEAAIVVDSLGNNTRLTAQHTKRLMDQRGLRSAAVVTQYYHVSRSKLALRQEGVPNVTGAHAEYRFEIKDPFSIVREVVGFYSYLVQQR